MKTEQEIRKHIKILKDSMEEQGYKTKSMLTFIHALEWVLDEENENLKQR
jgi:hypothetical protein